MDRQRHFETRAVHSGEHRVGAKEGRDGTFYPISTPIYASTTFSHPNVETTDRVLGGEEQGYSYARYDNPTVRAFEEALVSLEVPRPGDRGQGFRVRLGDGRHARGVRGGGADGRGDGPRGGATLRLDGDAPGAGLRRERRRDAIRGRLRPRGGGEEGRPARAPRRRRRVHLQPALARRGYIGDLRDNPRRRGGPDRRQHLRYPVPPASPGARRGHRGPQRDQVPLRDTAT